MPTGKVAGQAKHRRLFFRKEDYLYLRRIFLLFSIRLQPFESRYYAIFYYLAFTVGLKFTRVWSLP